MDMLSDAISAAKLAESLGIVGILTILLFGAGYMLYKTMIIEHRKLVQTLDAMTDSIKITNERNSAALAMYERLLKAAESDNEKAFALHHNSIAKILELIRNIDSKLDRVLDKQNG